MKGGDSSFYQKRNTKGEKGVQAVGLGDKFTNGVIVVKFVGIQKRI